jgi:hypothetical protein
MSNEENDLIAAAKTGSGKKPLPPDVIRMPNANLTESLDGGTVKFTYTPLPVGGNPKDAVLRELTNQRSEEILNTIRGDLIRDKGSHLNISDVTGNAGGTVHGVNMSISGKFMWNSVDRETMDDVQTRYDYERTKVYVQWALDMREINPGKGATYTPPGGQPIHYSEENLNYLIREGGRYLKSFQSLEANDPNRINLSEKDLNRPIPVKLKSEADVPGIASTDAPTLVAGNDTVNRQFEQALKGANGDRDAAAVAVDAISKSPGYKPDQEISVVQGKNGGLIATQGQGDAALNVPVPEARQGDYERVARQMTEQPQQAQQIAQPDQLERARTV